MYDFDHDDEQAKPNTPPDDDELEITFKFGPGEFKVKGTRNTALEAADRQADNIEKLIRNLSSDYNIVLGQVVLPGISQAPTTPLLNEGDGDMTANNQSLTENDTSDSIIDLNPVERFAQLLGVSVEAVRGACDPLTSPPYMHLNRHNCKTFWANVGTRGRKSMAPIVLPATLLALWFDIAQIDGLTVALANDLLATVAERGDHPTRYIEQRDWLWPRNDGSLLLNPSKRHKAVAVARAYCLEEPLGTI